MKDRDSVPVQIYEMTNSIKNPGNPHFEHETWSEIFISLLQNF